MSNMRKKQKYKNNNYWRIFYKDWSIYRPTILEIISKNKNIVRMVDKSVYKYREEFDVIRFKMGLSILSLNLRSLNTMSTNDAITQIQNGLLEHHNSVSLRFHFS